MSLASELVQEHAEIKDVLDELEDFLDQEDLDHHGLAATLRELQVLWDVNEVKEEAFYKERLSDSSNNGAFEKMFLEQHKQLRGHWRILSDAVDTGSEEDIKVCLDTDGAMLFSKMRSHMAAEDTFLKKEGKGKETKSAKDTTSGKSTKKKK